MHRHLPVSYTHLDVYKRQQLVHADPAQHRAGSALDLHDALAAAQQTGVAVGVPGAEGGDLGGLFGGEVASVAGRLAGLHLLYHADDGLQLHHRAENAEAHLVAGVEAVEMCIRDRSWTGHPRGRR